MDFFRGLLSALFLTMGMVGLVHFSKEFGIKRGRELSSIEMNKKLKNCHEVITKTK